MQDDVSKRWPKRVLQGVTRHGDEEDLNYGVSFNAVLACNFAPQDADGAMHFDLHILLKEVHATCRMIARLQSRTLRLPMWRMLEW